MKLSTVISALAGMAGTLMVFGAVAGDVTLPPASVAAPSAPIAADSSLTGSISPLGSLPSTSSATYAIPGHKSSEITSEINSKTKGLASTSYVNSRGFATTSYVNSRIGSYATQAWVRAQGYITWASLPLCVRDPGAMQCGNEGGR